MTTIATLERVAAAADAHRLRATDYGEHGARVFHRQEFALTKFGMLDTFVVAANREFEGNAIATNEQRYAKGRQDELDGITVEFGEVGEKEWWWFNVRPSNTEPLLRMIVEASSAALRDQKKAELIGLLGTPE